MAGAHAVVGPTVAEGGTPLWTSFCFWYKKKASSSERRWGGGLSVLGEVGTAEGFWTLYNHLLRPSGSESGAVDVMVFQRGVTPEWEDKAHVGGGKLSVKGKRGALGAVWETLLLSYLGGSFPDAPPGSSTASGPVGLVTGLEFRPRYQDETLVLWTRGGDLLTTDSLARLRDRLAALLSVPAEVRIEFKPYKRGGTEVTLAPRPGEGRGDESPALSATSGGGAGDEGLSMGHMGTFSPHPSGGGGTSSSSSGPSGSAAHHHGHRSFMARAPDGGRGFSRSGARGRGRVGPGGRGGPPPGTTASATTTSFGGTGPPPKGARGLPPRGPEPKWSRTEARGDRWGGRRGGRSDDPSEDDAGGHHASHHRPARGSSRGSSDEPRHRSRGHSAEKSGGGAPGMGGAGSSSGWRSGSWRSGEAAATAVRPVSDDARDALLGGETPPGPSSHPVPGARDDRRKGHGTTAAQGPMDGGRPGFGGLIGRGSSRHALGARTSRRGGLGARVGAPRTSKDESDWQTAGE